MIGINPIKSLSSSVSVKFHMNSHLEKYFIRFFQSLWFMEEWKMLFSFLHMKDFISEL